MNKRNSGITLVALVITIIVLLIMAGVSIALVVGDNGVLSKAKEAKTGSLVAEEKEQVNLAYSSALTKNLGAAVTAENLQTELDESVGSGKTTVTVNGNNITVLFNETGNTYNLNNGRVTESNNGSTSLTDLEKLQIYFSNVEEIWDAFDDDDNFRDMDPILDASTSITEIEFDSEFLFIKYNNKYYQVMLSTKEVSLLTDLEKLQLYADYSGGIWANFTNKTFKDNIEPIPDANTSISFIIELCGNDDIYYYIIQYNNKYYTINGETGEIEELLMTFDTFGIYTIKGVDVLVTPSTPEYLIHINYYGPSTAEDDWQMIEEPYILIGGYTTSDNGRNHAYDAAGNLVFLAQ